MDSYETLRNEIEIQYGSVYHFAEVLGVAQSNFSKMKNKGITACSPQILSKVAVGLGLDYAELREGRVVIKPLTPEEIIRYKSEKIASATDVPLNPIEEDILTNLRGLDVSGQFKVLEYIKDITPKYERKD